MKMYDIILKKRQGGELSSPEIEHFVSGCVSGTIPDYQISALLMAIFFRGLNRRETTDLTLHMLRSGDIVDLSALPGIKVDKHSTGGVGDKTTLVLGPLVASAGVQVAKMSGRGLGHTGGTIDKLESIPGFNVEINKENFLKQVESIGIAVVSQTGNLVPADKKLYGMRDVTATVENISLIASSVMSKKLASGADAIVLDVKVGRGAFMKSIKEAEELAGLMVDTGNNLGRNTVALITRMDQPLGLTVGNSLEVREAIETLSNRGPEDLRELCLALGAEMVVLAGKAGSSEEARAILEENLSSGLALDKFGQMIDRQGGDSSALKDFKSLPEASLKKDITAAEPGFVYGINAMSIGLAAMGLGAGRETRESVIDLSAGIVLHKKEGDTVSRGEALATLHYNPGRDAEYSEALVKGAFTIGNKPPEKLPIVIQKINQAGSK
ncbi:MAG: thymidine phosphorylase [Peptococcaceae bacterium BICA1-7]|nr:MAG: thymidine phosphorylase [Peptococcaceae bacterium BICA1-7]HBV96887.1 pyrimidine-nucleoside phosphorylase [Desulfotomaculum sp.]